VKYSVATWKYDFAESWQKDLFEQSLADVGFDSFETDEVQHVLAAYIPTALLNEDVLRDTAETQPSVCLLGVEACEDKNWNETWEAEHPMMELPLGVRIQPHCAFGAGYHETTEMMTERLVERQKSKVESIAHVLDNGCGTGVLGIMAARVGATQVTMIDIDEKSVENAKENIELNKQVVGRCRFTVLQGDTPPKGCYDLILSNIHRNILLQQMPLYAAYLAPKGEVWLSGFYEQDCSTLLAAAAKAGLQLKDKQQRGEWIQLVLYQPLTAAAE